MWVIRRGSTPYLSHLERSHLLSACRLDDASADTSNEPERIVMLPWELPGLSEAMRSRMRALSQERSIFLAPPTGGHSSFRFDLPASLPLIVEALAVDKRLDEQRNLLVPLQASSSCSLSLTC